MEPPAQGRWPAPHALERTQLMDCIEVCESKEAELRSLCGQPQSQTVRPDYDDLRGHPKQEMDRMLQFLEALLPLQSDVKRTPATTSARPSRILMRSITWLRGTPYEGMIRGS